MGASLARGYGAPHRECAQLDVDIFVTGERAHAGAPFGEDLGGLTGVGPAQNRTAEMIQDDREADR